MLSSLRELLLKGLYGESKDLNQDGFVNLNELEEYTAARVSEYTSMSRDITYQRPRVSNLDPVFSVQFPVSIRWSIEMIPDSLKEKYLQALFDRYKEFSILAKLLFCSIILLLFLLGARLGLLGIKVQNASRLILPFDINYVDPLPTRLKILNSFEHLILLCHISQQPVKGLLHVVFCNSSQ